MRSRFAVLYLVTLMEAASAAQQQDLAVLAWLAGTWEMTQGATLVEEHWTTPSANMMVGMSRTVEGGRTTGFEFLRIEKRGDDLYYVPQPGGRPPVAFKLTSVAGGSFVFEQTGEDRVKKIEYMRDGADALTARVHGIERDKPFVIEYRYRRKR